MLTKFSLTFKLNSFELCPFFPSVILDNQGDSLDSASVIGNFIKKKQLRSGFKCLAIMNEAKIWTKEEDNEVDSTMTGPMC